MHQGGKKICGNYDEFILLLFLHTHREASAFDNEFPEESDKFCFLCASCFANWKGAVDLIMAKCESHRSISFSF